MLGGIWMQENPLIWMQENPIKIRGEHTCSIWDQFEKYNSSLGMLGGIWMQENPIKIRGIYKGVYSYK